MWLAPGVACADEAGRAPVVIRMTEPAIPGEVLRLERRPTFFDIHGVGSFGAFFAGAFTAFTAHETGHVVANLAYGNVPGVRPILYGGFIPFFTVDAHLKRSPDDRYYKDSGDLFTPGRHGYYVINTMGFQVQNIGSEILLSVRPDLRHEDSPFWKGYLLMNIGLSLGYGTAALLDIEDKHGDLHGASQRGPFSHSFLAVTTIAPALLDLGRYLFPENRVLPWLSRGSKTLFLGMDVKW